MSSPPPLPSGFTRTTRPPPLPRVLPLRLPPVLPTIGTPANARSVRLGALGVLALLAALLLGLVDLALIGLGNTGTIGLIVGIILAFLPVPIYLLIVTWIDRYEPEPLIVLGMAFLWGATGAAFVGLLFNSVAGAIVGAAMGDSAGQFAAISVSAPIVEETAKGLALLVVFLWRRHDFDGVMDGIVYAAMIGLGFAMTENVSYYGKPLADEASGGAVASVFIFILRGVLLPFAHPLFTSMTGIGLGLAADSRKTAVKILAPFAGWICAIALHAINNNLSVLVELAGGDKLAGLAAVVLVMILLGACFASLITFAMFREARIIRENLAPEVADGTLTPAQLAGIDATFGRIGHTLGDIFGLRFGRFLTRQRFYRLAGELAFHRRALAKGRIPDDPSARSFEATLKQMLRPIAAQALPRAI